MNVKGEDLEPTSRLMVAVWIVGGYQYMKVCMFI